MQGVLHTCQDKSHCLYISTTVQRGVIWKEQPDSVQHFNFSLEFVYVKENVTLLKHTLPDILICNVKTSASSTVKCRAWNRTLYDCSSKKQLRKINAESTKIGVGNKWPRHANDVLEYARLRVTSNPVYSLRIRFSF